MTVYNIHDSGMKNPTGFQKTIFIIQHYTNLDIAALCVFQNKVNPILLILNKGKKFIKYNYYFPKRSVFEVKQLLLKIEIIKLRIYQQSYWLM